MLKRGRFRRSEEVGCRFEILEHRQLLATVMWDGGGDGVTLTDASNWAGDVLPGPDDDAVIDVPGTATVEHANGSIALRSLTVHERFNVYGGFITATGTSSVYGELNWSGGAIQGPWNSSLMIMPGATLNISGPIDPRTTVRNAGTMNWTTGDIRGGGEFRIVNQMGATFSISAGQCLIESSAWLSQITNFGAMLVAVPHGEQVLLDTVLVNRGTLTVQSGRLAAISGGSLGGDIVLAAAAGLDLWWRFWNEACTISGEGTVRFLGGVHTLGGVMQLSAPTIIDGGVISGPGDLVLDAHTQWVHGSMIGSGRTVLAPGRSLFITGPFTVGLGRDLISQGTIEHGGGAIRFLGARLTNAPGASYRNSGGAHLTGAGTLSNEGEVVKTGPSSSNVQIALDNTGMLSVRGGLLKLSGGGTSAGPRHIAQGAALVYEGAYAHGAGSDTSGGGDLYLLGGVHELSGNWTVRSHLRLLGTMGGPGTLRVTGRFWWIGGEIGGSGNVGIEPGGKLAIVGNQAHVLRRTIINRDQLHHLSGELSIVAPGVLRNSYTDNNPSGWAHLVLVAGGVLGGGTAPGLLENWGILRKIGPSQLIVQIPLNNHTIVEANGGEVRFRGGVAQVNEHRLTAGSWRVGPAGTLSISEQPITVMEHKASLRMRRDIAGFPDISGLQLNRGWMNIDAAVQFSPLSGTFRNEYAIELKPGASLRVDGHLHSEWTIHARVASPSLYATIHATSFSGSINAWVVHASNLAPGTRLRIMTWAAQPPGPIYASTHPLPSGAGELRIESDGMWLVIF